MRWVILGRPHLGGTTVFARRLKRALAEKGVQLEYAGPATADCGSTAAGIGESCEYRVIPVREPDGRTKVGAILDFVRESGCDGVIFNVFSDIDIMNAIRYLDSTISRIVVVHSTSVATYRAARALAPFADFVVAISPRIAADLRPRLDIDPARVVIIPHGVDDEWFSVLPMTNSRKISTCAYIGRLADVDKGIFMLPEIAAKCAGVGLDFVIVGDGPDRRDLEECFRDKGCNARFYGAVFGKDLREIVERVELVVVPSRFEGFCQVAAEAMAAGRVVVASRLRGVTDWMVSNGYDGCLFPLGSADAAAAILKELARDPPRVRLLGERARDTARKRFKLSAFGDAYASLLAKAVRSRGGRRQPESLSAYRIPGELRPGLRAWVPEALKRRLRLLRESLV
jgi:glycosyltransferase involved in cell wall biosynthesis